MGKRHPIWQYFIAGTKQNGSHLRAHCIGCVEAQRPEGLAIDLTNNDPEKLKLSSESWVIEACKKDVGGVLGVKESMAAHILGKAGPGGKPCQDEEDSGDVPAQKRKIIAKVENHMKQTQLKVFRGIQVPFTAEQVPVVQAQFLRATVSANLPFQWTEDPEVIKLFYLFRSTAGEVIPSRYQISGPLLDDANATVTQNMKKTLRGEYAVIASDGWKDDSRNAITGVNLTVEGKCYLIDLIPATAHKKDRASMCLAFEKMIDKAEDDYGIVVVGFCCDNDGGSQRGRKDLIQKRPWLFGTACCAHQLILGDYFEEDEEAAEVAERATALIGWINNHGRVRSVFDEVQAESSTPLGQILAYLVANMTRWTTHFIAFDRLFDLKDPLRRAVTLRKQDIIDGQVGAEKNTKKLKLKAEAEENCEQIEDGSFWRSLKAVVDDLEPICLGTNLNQGDAMRPDQAVLTFAGIYLYFKNHSKPSVAAGMKKRIEKRWKAMDQPMFILTLMLNPFEGLSHFGDQAEVSQFTLNTILLQTYRRVQSRPHSEDTEVQRIMNDTKEAEISTAFLGYLGGTGAFADWERNKESFQQVHGDNPLAVWKVFRTNSSVAELANFAIMLLSISVNQAGLERNFSDLKIKKTRLRNRLKLPRLEKMSKVGASIRASHKEEGLVEDHEKRKNHKDSKLGELLVVPRYADLLEEDEGDAADNQSIGGEPQDKSGLVKTQAGWRKEMSKWVQKEREEDLDLDSTIAESVANAVYGRNRSRWLPRSLELLFGGRKEIDKDEQRRRDHRRTAYTEEARLMELLANEEADEERIPDDGELEGSGNEY
ncbi:ribonuclease H-like domain-containing protein [Gymnopilus junonius]|uniref:Ribonuclease H-like domain-containing protein n=1 Tax=Gymnopilus junonius TaxID=109634 RepID=A0A9P5TGH4_GYMJU|nr:ribonuclease H-like domain-containing protein [Gymnopilus junonius]